MADSKTGYFGVSLNQPGKPKPYQAQVKCGGKDMYLGCFATAEEAALCIARSPEGQAAAERAAAAPPPPPPLTSEGARQQAHAEKLTLLVAESKTGYIGVNLVKPGQPNPYQAEVRRDGKKLYLGSFATAEEAALCVARTPEGQAAAGRPAAAAPLTSEGARQQAQAEGLTLLVGRSGRGYFGVHHKPGKSKPYEAMVWRGGKTVHLSYSATAEEAALCIARSPEGQAAARRAPPATRWDAARNAAQTLASEDALQQAREATIRAVALDIIYEAAGAATGELSAEVAAEVMAGIAMGL